MRVTLVNPPYPKGSPESIFLPLGIGYLAAVIEKGGYDVDIIDCQVFRLSRKQLEKELHLRHPHAVGITASTLTFKPAIEIAKIVKEVLPECLIVMGGPHVTIMDKETLIQNPEIDVVVRREGEQTILELLNAAFRSNIRDFSGIPGITFRKNGQLIRSPDRPFIQNLDELPYPAFKLFSLKKYRIFGKTYLPIITSRGCPFRCTFCMASQMCGARFRARSPRNVVDELELLWNEYGADAVTFYDDTFTFDIERVYKICKEMKSRKIRLPWDCRTRVDMISEKLLSTMSSANCQLIHFGVESGSQRILNAMKKGTTVKQNEKAIKLAKKAGMLVAISVILGYPGETVETLNQTMDFIRKTEPDYVYMCVATPYPGTELYSQLKTLGWNVSTQWEHYNEQTLVFENPNFKNEKILEIRRKFYDNYFSISYILQKSLRRDFYSRIMARIALNDFLWRMKLPRRILKKLVHQKSET